MSKQGKIFFSFSVLAFLILGSSRLIYGGWHPALWVPLGLMLFLFAAGVAVDHKALRAIFGMRTTKHGMNLGALIIVVLVSLTCVNYLASQHDKKFDWTSDKFNSLSEQSVKAATSLKTPTELVLLFRKDASNHGAQSADLVARQAKSLADMYRNASNKVTYVAYDGLQRPDLAQKFEFQTGQFVMFATQGERKVKVDPVSEEGITRALMKLARDKKKTIYFTRGHGELLLDDKETGGLSVLKDDLSVTYDVKSFALFETGDKVPEDADVVAVVGPKTQFLEAELGGLREYARRGGHLLIAIDPGVKQNLAQLAKTFGVDFHNNYVLDLRSRVFQASPTLIIGSDFSPTNDITKGFIGGGNAITIFELASSLTKATDAPSSLNIDEFVKTDASTAAVPELHDKIEYKANGPHTIGISVSGKLAIDVKTGQTLPEAKQFGAVIFGDSDFISNRLLNQNLNRDLIENSVAWLSNDTDLITIRPKQPKGTHLDMPTGSFYSLILALFLITVALFGSGISFWWRRRTA